jgi:hypothetical protein
VLRFVCGTQMEHREKLREGSIANQSQSTCVEGIVNLFTVIDEFSPRQELFRAISAKSGIKLPEKEDLFPTLRGK